MEHILTLPLEGKQHLKAIPMLNYKKKTDEQEIESNSVLKIDKSEEKHDDLSEKV